MREAPVLFVALSIRGRQTLTQVHLRHSGTQNLALREPPAHQILLELPWPVGIILTHFPLSLNMACSVCFHCVKDAWQTVHSSQEILHTVL